MSWHEVPSPPRRVDGVRRWRTAVLAGAPLLAATGDLASPLGWWIGWASPVVVLVVLVTFVAQRRPAAVAPVAAVAAGALAAGWGNTAGAKVAVVAACITTAWCSALPSSATDRSTPAARRPTLLLAISASAALLLLPGLLPGAALAGAAAVVALGSHRWAPTAARLGAVLEPVAIPFRDVAHRAEALVLRALPALGRAVAAVAMVPAAATTTVAWLLHRLVGHDPTRSRSAVPGGWVRRLGDDTAPDRLYAKRPVQDDRPRRERLSAAGSGMLVLAATVVTAIVLLDAGWSDRAAPVDRTSASSPPATTTASDPSAACEGIETNAVVADQPDAATMLCERAQVMSAASYRASTGFQLRDFAGATINVSDGVRRTWRPPACTCRRLRVWWLGGSAAWGEGQRDDWSLPSMLAKAAWRNGIALDIENHAVPTFTFNQEVHLLAELTTTTPPPDLIISFSGGNDLVFQALRHSRGTGEDDSDIVLYEQTYDDLLRNGIPIDPTRVRWTPNPQEVDASIPPEVGAALARTTVERYRRNLGLAQRLAASVDRPFVAVWQPLLAGSAPSAGLSGAVPPGLLESFTLMQAEARAALPPDVIDLGDLFSDAESPIFYDLFHMGEAGAAATATRLLDRLEPVLRSTTG